jgi:hypothetical protein
MQFAMPSLQDILWGKYTITNLSDRNYDESLLSTGIYSCYSEDEVDKKIGRAKVSGFIQKPYRMKSLLSIVERVMC